MSNQHTPEVTNVTELAYCLSASGNAKESPEKVCGVASRFWHDGDTYEQALARQQDSFDRIKSRAAAPELLAALVSMLHLRKMPDEVAECARPRCRRYRQSERKQPMKTIKVSEAEGVVLDYLVAKCEGKRYGDIGHGQIYVHNPDGTLYCSKNLWIPSTNWSQGGPIIERECIATYASGACSVSPKNPDYWVAEILATDEMLTQFGPTPLLAAMRCYVASKLGDTAEVPEELL